MAGITLSSVVKTYAGATDPTVKGVDLSIEDGEFCVLVGPSGCGKSTLLRMIAGLETVTGGEIAIGGRVVNDLEPMDRDIAMVFQNYALYPHMTVRQNLSYGLKNRRMPKPEIASRVEEVARILQIGSFLDRKPRALSGGQRQRVAMGRAIVREPSVFLFDEPLSNLDAKLRVSMRGEIKQLQKRLGTTSVYVTHDQMEAMTLADKLVVLNGGQIEQVGTPLELYRNPQTVFVAGFIGSPGMNLIDARIENGALMVDDLMLLSDVAGKGEVVAGLRPETIGLRAGTGFRTSYVEDLGNSRLVHGMLGGQPFAAQVAPDTEIAPQMQVTLQAGGLHLFDALTGRRLPQTQRAMAMA
ncbi:sn-glycerol-3-phosphate ABC transporter ATP-binding protein UgpC [Thioclava litoralis]|uniref:Sn-glycerol-3-phosphate ABC transporter ATP-binding protein UgpC n=1 Tax=Thioclava litoralis TaxID=3076557 RepID=A0ABZ1DY84_9RHOB|nr:sn-glycerol-3-phosphate ABC transporter ATP-binding protein UgpC [Thioclava sp. FTW29]